MASGAPSGAGEVDPELISRKKFGSGNPHTQSALDDQGTVTGCDELKAAEAPPGAVSELARDVMQQQRDFESGDTGAQGAKGGEGGGGGTAAQARTGPDEGGAGLGDESRQPNGAAAACKGYSDDGM